MTIKAMIYVQHLLGIGHYIRVGALAEALLARGARVTFVTGGMPVPGREPRGVDIVQLPPIRVTGTDFSKPVTEDGSPLDAALEEVRRTALIESYRQARPDVLVTELFPFGRWRLRTEIIPLLKAANASRPRPAIVCSIRDILQKPLKPGRTNAQMDIMQGYYDGALVHGETDLTPVIENFPAAARLDGRLEYTGYVADQAIPVVEGEDGAEEIIVASGGGAVGAPLLQAALAARARGCAAGHTWRFLIGPNLPRDIARQLKNEAGGIDRAPVIVEANRPDYRGLLARAACSISQSGYNTMMDVLATGVPAVVIPFAGDGETEQRVRARLFADHGIVDVVDDGDLTPVQITDAVDRILTATRGAHRIKIPLDGAERGAGFLMALAKVHREARPV